MKRLTVEAIQSQIPRSLSLDLIGDGSARNPDVFIGILKRWILLHVVIVDEFEEVISPLVMINEIAETGRSAGDCDDIAMLAASLIASIGAQVRFEARFRSRTVPLVMFFVNINFRSKMILPILTQLSGI